MAEKKATKAAAPKATATKAAPKKAAVKKSVLELTAENAGFKAGDVYQALATAEKALAAAGSAQTLAEITKASKISSEEAILGIGWLLKEGKIKAEDNKVVLA